MSVQVRITHSEVNNMALSYEEKKENMLRARAVAQKNGATPYSRLKKEGRKARRRGPNITKERMKMALPGTSGIMSRIAERLEVSRHSVQMYLHREGNEDMLELYHEELESVADLAEETIEECMRSEQDPVRLKAATWYLEKKDKGQERGYNSRKTVTLEGGSNPIQVQSNVLPVETLPLHVRVAILKAIEEGEEEGTNGIGNGTRMTEEGDSRLEKKQSRMQKQSRNRNRNGAPSSTNGNGVGKLRVKLKKKTA